MSSKEFLMFLKMMSRLIDNGDIKGLESIVNDMIKDYEPEKKKGE